MSMFSLFNIAGSGMNAQSLRLNLIASNIANADSVAGSEEDAYKARNPVFAALFEQNYSRQPATTGVRMLGVLESEVPHTIRFDPGHPLADEDGYIFESNVDTVEEMTNMISASRSFQNNVEIANTGKELLLRTLRLGE